MLCPTQRQIVLPSIVSVAKQFKPTFLSNRYLPLEPDRILDYNNNFAKTKYLETDNEPILIQIWNRPPRPILGTIWRCLTEGTAQNDTDNTF